ncbi:MAG TPA: hypothetical protein ENJ30_02010 [Desulfobulbaceae bacterium]|nr:hypothetical protein [Desulfobulbaceae bacterium]
MTNDYDHHFRLYASIYFDGEVDWPWFKAQGVVESGLNPTAVSQAGAMGIMQLLPETAEEAAAELWVENKPFDPRRNILLGIHYMHKQWSIWKNEKGIERLRFALGAYNAGAGHIIKAQRLARTKDQWASIAAVLPEVTGRHARETIAYVKKVEETRAAILAD